MQRDRILAKIRQIELESNRHSQMPLSGRIKSHFQGQGMAFREVRSYFPGDDVRTLDWNVTARYNEPFVKVFEEEREQEIMVLVDVSASMYYGDYSSSKIEKSLEVLATIAFSGVSKQDKVGAIFHAQGLEAQFTPKKGKANAFRMVDALLRFSPKQEKTDLNEAIKLLRKPLKKGRILFVLSDFMGQTLDQTLWSEASKNQSILAVNLHSPSEGNLPKQGIFGMLNPETGDRLWVNGFSRKTRNRWQATHDAHQGAVKDFFQQKRIPYLVITTEDEHLLAFHRFFHMRK